MLRTFRAAFWTAIAVTLAFAWAPHPPQLLATDKSEHMLAFAVLTILAILAYPRVSIWKSAAFLLCLGALIELVQGTAFIHRDCDIHDWFADAIAIVVAAALTKAVNALLARRRAIAGT